MADETLFEKYGGFGSINRVVMDFYDTLLDSDEIGPYFDNVDMPQLIDHQTKFVSALLGGPAELDDGQLRRAHGHLGITDAHFDEMKQAFGETLANHGFSPDDVETATSAIEARRNLIVVS